MYPLPAWINKLTVCASTRLINPRSNSLPLQCPLQCPSSLHQKVLPWVVWWDVPSLLTSLLMHAPAIYYLIGSAYALWASLLVWVCSVSFTFTEIILPNHGSTPVQLANWNLSANKCALPLRLASIAHHSCTLWMIVCALRYTIASLLFDCEKDLQMSIQKDRFFSWFAWEYIR